MLRRPGRRAVRTTVVVLVVCSLLAVTAACADDERSADAFCAALTSEGRRLASEHGMRAGARLLTGDGLVGFVVALVVTGEAHGDLVEAFGRLEAVSPEDVAPAVQRVLVALDAQAFAASTLLEDPIGSFGSGASASGSGLAALVEVGTYAERHCSPTGRLRS